jgi:broad specificity phosphatase PhoE
VKSTAVRLVLVRHGEVDANRRFLYLGHRDDPLNETGRRQAAALATGLSGWPVSLIVSSPLDRARATAESLAAAHDVPIETDQRLIELDFGRWEGRARQEVAASSPEERRILECWEADPAIPVPGGESLREVRDRAVGLADDLARERPRSTVALVSHMGPIKTLLCAALDLPLTGARRIFLDPATISVLDWGPTPVVRLVNSHAHLGSDAARWLDKP